jgi:hypothetical protein
MIEIIIRRKIVKSMNFFSIIWISLEVSATWTLSKNSKIKVKENQFKVFLFLSWNPTSYFVSHLQSSLYFRGIFANDIPWSWLISQLKISSTKRWKGSLHFWSKGSELSNGSLSKDQYKEGCWSHDPKLLSSSLSTFLEGSSFQFSAITTE